ncbi:MAG TPA: hypothetical protein GX510_07435 [Firmicutes bacterium]|nr:hypothetical protein [Candidatus Fermentithermobacillaceae bacterium]
MVFSSLSVAKEELNIEIIVIPTSLRAKAVRGPEWNIEGAPVAYLFTRVHSTSDERMNRRA